MYVFSFTKEQLFHIQYPGHGLRNISGSSSDSYGNLSQVIRKEDKYLTPREKIVLQ